MVLGPEQKLAISPSTTIHGGQRAAGVVILPYHDIPLTQQGRCSLRAAEANKTSHQFFCCALFRAVRDWLLR